MKTILAFFIFTLTFQGLLSQTENQEISASPNPFVSSTNITIYDLNHDTVTVNIFTMTGAKVATLFDSLVLSGTISVVFNGSALPDGFYLVQLIKNSTKTAAKIIKVNTAGISIENHNKVSFKIFPNPVDDYLTIASEKSIQSCKVYTTSGRLVKNIDKNVKKIALMDLNAGVYILSVVADNQTYIQRFIKK